MKSHEIFSIFKITWQGMEKEIISFLLLIPVIFTFPILAKSQTRKPNVIFIYADDLGRGMLSCYGQKLFSTPNIDRLASEGVRFTNIYGAHFCAPARASFLTGYYDCRKDKWKLTDGGIYETLYTKEYTLNQIEARLDSVIGNPRGNIMYLPHVFKKAGYVTAEVGKLEWGFSTSFKQMKEHGWDYYFGYLDHVMCHGFYPSFLFENGKMIHIPGNTRPWAGVSNEYETPQADEARWDRVGREVYSEDLFMNKVTAFIQQNKDHPFFLYFPTQIPHGPVAIPAISPEVAFDSLSETEKEYASMVIRLDSDVGTIMAELRRLGIANNTILIFSADNGHELYYSQKGVVDKPYRNIKTGQPFNNITTKFYSDIGGDVFNGNSSLAGLKRSNWEGGVRVPLIIRWPGKIKPGRVSNTLITNYDFISTMADFLHVKLTDHKDGVSYLPLLLGKPFVHEHSFVVYASFMGPALVTKAGWKLRYFASKKVFQLYYLPDDYQERHNVILQYPKKADSLKALLEKACDGNLNNGWFRPEKDLLSWK